MMLARTSLLLVFCGLAMAAVAQDAKPASHPPGKEQAAKRTSRSAVKTPVSAALPASAQPPNPPAEEHAALQTSPLKQEPSAQTAIDSSEDQPADSAENTSKTGDKECKGTEAPDGAKICKRPTVGRDDLTLPAPQ